MGREEYDLAREEYKMIYKGREEGNDVGYVVLYMLGWYYHKLVWYHMTLAQFELSCEIKRKYLRDYDFGVGGVLNCIRACYAAKGG